jgi:hypothetical protein
MQHTFVIVVANGHAHKTVAYSLSILSLYIVSFLFLLIL